MKAGGLLPQRLIRPPNNSCSSRRPQTGNLCRPSGSERKRTLTQLALLSSRSSCLLQSASHGRSRTCRAVCKQAHHSRIWPRFATPVCTRRKAKLDSASAKPAAGVWRVETETGHRARGRGGPDRTTGRRAKLASHVNDKAFPFSSGKRKAFWSSMTID